MRAVVLAIVLSAPLVAPAAACGIAGGKGSVPIPPPAAAIDGELQRGQAVAGRPQPGRAAAGANQGADGPRQGDRGARRRGTGHAGVGLPEDLAQMRPRHLRVDEARAWRAATLITSPQGNPAPALPCDAWRARPGTSAPR